MAWRIRKKADTKAGLYFFDSHPEWGEGEIWEWPQRLPSSSESTTFHWNASSMVNGLPYIVDFHHQQSSTSCLTKPPWSLGTASPQPLRERSRSLIPFFPRSGGPGSPCSLLLSLDCSFPINLFQSHCHIEVHASWPSTSFPTRLSLAIFLEIPLILWRC